MTAQLKKKPKDSSKKKPYHHGELRNALIMEAVLVIQKRGTPSFELRDLAHRLEVTHPAIYRHFKNHRDLLASVAEQGHRLLSEQLKATYDRYPDDPVGFYQENGSVYLKFAASNPGYYRTM